MSPTSGDEYGGLVDLTRKPHIQGSRGGLMPTIHVDGVVLARLQGSSLTPFEPMSQDNSRRFQSYCQRFSPSAFPRIPLAAVRDRNGNLTLR
ncbi:Tetratricopeptide repeat protein 36 [Dissostichus eleginoides]|uniref:Tetratricopeptide repeat protein 36 n=1 Tax=Dissostichus eleginoides TaxID=100907 RepID=A0AAD9CSR6_DISEL|nr:Tetratricopeptide repeat protein 36 [Dissostichus eleginoides]